MKKVLLSLALLLAPLGHVFAQDAYTIYPIPHMQEVLPGTTSFTQQVTIVADAPVDQVTINRAVQILADRGLEAIVADRASATTSNVYLGVEGAKGAASAYAKKLRVKRNVFGTPGKYDRHVLTIGGKKKADVLILGENTDATFCGLASLEQMLDRGTTNLPCVTIEDYADIQYRGVIEGYYGVPYSAEVTKDIFRFMARYKMNAYMYGAKSDPYHSQKWAEAYPDSITPKEQAIGCLSSDMMRDIVSVSHDNKVNFIWAIHPGGAFTNPDDKTVIDRIMQKFQIMHDLGVRQFGCFVDDIGVPTDEASLRINAERLGELQTAVENRWNKSYTTPADTVKPINFVPQLYAYSWVDAETRANFYGALGKTHPHVIVYITGKNIWSVPNSEDLDVVSAELGRGLAWWWNYPCNDNDMSKLFVRDTYANFADEKWIDPKATLPTDLRGASALIANPMQQGEASKIALFGVGNYSWNNATFDNESDYHAAVKAVVGKEKAADFEYLSQYLRYFDNEPIASLVEAYKRDGKSAPVKAEMLKLLAALQSIQSMTASGKESDALFVADIQPWLNRLGDMATLTLQLLDHIDAKAAGRQSEADRLLATQLKKSVADFDHYGNHQFSVLNGLGDEIELSTIISEPSGKVLRPFLDYLAEKL